MTVEVMGIVNVTPDSFSGDGLAQTEAAVAQASRMIEDGASILDIGGESSRPGAEPVLAEEEIRRVVPVIAAIRKRNATISISIDTVKAEVAEAAVKAGADLINDISALSDPRMARIAAQSGAKLCLMHNRAKGVQRDVKIGGTYTAPDYKDVVAEVAQDLQAAVERAMQSGVARSKIILDPGIGFGKNPQQNLALIAHLDAFKKLGFPVLAGPSRKSFIGLLLDLPVEERLEGTAACVVAAVLKGADIIRVHDVKFMARAVKMAEMLRDA